MFGKFRGSRESNKMSEAKQPLCEMEVDENNGPAAEAPMEVAAGSVEKGPSTSGTSSNPNSACRVMASSGTVGSVSISLHPLVIMNVSEHWTRLRAQEGSDQLGTISTFLCFPIN